MNNKDLLELHTACGAWCNGDKTYYVKHSENIWDCPGARSLFSIHFSPDELPVPQNLRKARVLMERMSKLRLYDAPIQVSSYLTSKDSKEDHGQKLAQLHIYKIEFQDILFPPRLNPGFYSEGAWLSPEQILEKIDGKTPGAGIRAWLDYSLPNKIEGIEEVKGITNPKEEKSLTERV